MGCYLSIAKTYRDRATKTYRDRATLGRVEMWGEVGKSVFANADTRPQVTAPRLSHLCDILLSLWRIVSQKHLIPRRVV